ncbi:MAG: cellobiose system component [Thermoanaerobacteraceae bacterium]|jgi:PTS system cellobiose-specific IIA component|uniref:PTS lactose/cellobiose transporter subunit IIA n=1 Tax=Biomaibacter acetigenes TaxID=2316383 RepID=A0A3G2R7T2_9FIRM|nr:PTS lactose/cellobiose transporter subunit IIA [Biomaibacter acetigenes]AYO31532.1 PTS lactose/cellobiose transporter subunit IIA [Biomaibacter acetigenes]MDK2877877.1 cellobiose system component [Thermoanaerobacteraceae bacterium]MDN5312242.1 cellobiose system component [Thermoanaerobacteraceae bacterium]
MDYEKIIFTIIAHAGNARSLCFEALKFAKLGDPDKAYEKVSEAKEELLKAHNIQSDMLHTEAAGEKHEFSLLLVHAQDHLMCAMLVKDLVEEFIELYKTIFKTKDHIG